MITLIIIFAIVLGILAVIKESCKLISKLILFFVGFIIISALLSTVFVVMKVILKIAMMALGVCVIASVCRRLLK
ncbi:MAG: hypothetical protein E7213_09140 [Clostridium sp.]|nr:hypothetical protein [Clostridium sp.]